LELLKPHVNERLCENVSGREIVLDDYIPDFIPERFGRNKKFQVPEFGFCDDDDSDDDIVDEEEEEIIVPVVEKPKINHEDVWETGSEEKTDATIPKPDEIKQKPLPLKEIINDWDDSGDDNG